MAARFRVIVLDQDDRTFHYVLWADVPVARQPFYANPAAVSAWKDALPADNAQLVSGAVTEKTGSVVFPTGTGIAASQAALQDLWQSFQSRVTNDNMWIRYGSTWDGATWVMTGVA